MQPALYPHIDRQLSAVHTRKSDESCNHVHTRKAPHFGHIDSQDLICCQDTAFPFFQQLNSLYDYYWFLLLNRVKVEHSSVCPQLRTTQER